MAMTVDAVYNNSVDSPGFVVTVDDINPVRNRLLIIRRDAWGEHPDSPVRGADGITLTGDSTFVVTDYENPITNPVDYVAYAYDEGTDPVTGDVQASDVYFPTEYRNGEAWLKSISQPALSRQVNVVDWNDVSTPGRVLGEYEVLGRKNKVVITDVPGGREGTLVVGAYPINGSYVNADWRSLRMLFEHGKTLFLQTSGQTWTGELDMYLEVKSVRRRRIGPVGLTAELVYVYDVEYVEVDRPSTAEEALGLVSWQDVLDGYFDWQEVLDFNGSWLDLLDG
ncbi:hypothetical protein ACFP2T_35760 [Plantactinospora solaniradicis]|uniref:Minor tail protein n=1 Tax=Plantactinospora solaniradicis TaxID=1723736 RepID=A0ABW1KL12_9ACTN